MKYYYKIVNGKIGKLLNESQLAEKGLTEADMLTDGRTIADTDDAMFKVFEACGQADKAAVYGVYLSPLTTEQITAAALAKNKFTKLQIRRALRVLGQEAALDILLTNDAFRKDWQDAIEIDLNDTLTKQALTSLNVDVNAVKIAISNLE